MPTDLDTRIERRDLEFRTIVGVLGGVVRLLLKSGHVAAALRVMRMRKTAMTKWQLGEPGLTSRE